MTLTVQKERNEGGARVLSILLRMQFPDWISWYKKPEYRDIKEYSTAVRQGKRQLSPDGRGKTAIPSRLALERVLENKTCSPMSLYDFYMYLKHIELSPENLEFYVWFKNYERQYAKEGSFVGYGDKDESSSFTSSEPKTSCEKSPTFSHTSTIRVTDDFECDPEVAQETLNSIANMINPESLCAGGVCSPRFSTRIRNFVSAFDSTPGSTTDLNSPEKAILPTAQRPFSRSPELNAVVRTFLLPGSEKELNIPPGVRDQALMNLQKSSDPSHLRPIAEHVYALLRNCSHRNFVRLGVGNGTFETICVATSLGIFLTVAGVLVMLLRCFVPYIGAHSRWEAFAPWPMWWLGISLILSGLRGSCFFLLLFSRRQPLPWERFDDSSSMLSTKSKGILNRISRLMIFDRKFKVKDVHLRRLQRKIVIQSLVGGAVFASLGVVLFIFLPVWTETVKHKHHT